MPRETYLSARSSRWPLRLEQSTRLRKALITAHEAVSFQLLANIGRESGTVVSRSQTEGRLSAVALCGVTRAAAALTSSSPIGGGKAPCAEDPPLCPPAKRLLFSPPANDRNPVSKSYGWNVPYELALVTQ